MTTTKDYVFACLRHQRLDENVTLHRISEDVKLLLDIAKQSDNPRHSFTEGTLQVFGAILSAIDFRLEEVEIELALINNNDARLIRPLTIAELDVQYLVNKAATQDKVNGHREERQENHVPGTKKRARRSHDDDEMAAAEQPQAKQPHPIAQPRRSRFLHADSNSQAVCNTGIVAPQANVFPGIQVVVPPPQQQQQLANAANFPLPPAGEDDMDVDMDEGIEMGL